MATSESADSLHKQSNDGYGIQHDGYETWDEEDEDDEEMPLESADDQNDGDESDDE